MRAGNAREIAERRDARQDRLAVRGVLLHRGPFGLVELARLVEDRIAHAELADVVQQRGALEPAAPLGRKAHLLGDQVGEQRDALAVSAGVGALRVDHLREGGGDVVEIVLVDQRAALRRLEREDRLLQVVGAQRLPELRPRGDARERRRELRIEPAAGAALDFAHAPPRCRSRSGTRRPPAPAGRCAHRPGSPSPREAERLAAAVPVLIEILDAGRDALRRSASCARSPRRDGSASRSARARSCRC